MPIHKAATAAGSIQRHQIKYSSTHKSFHIFINIFFVIYVRTACVVIQFIIYLSDVTCESITSLPPPLAPLNATKLSELI
jgi:hypothetical protein